MPIIELWDKDMIKPRLLFTMLMMALPTAASAQVCPSSDSALHAALHARHLQHVERHGNRVATVKQQITAQRAPVLGLGDSIMQLWPTDLLSQAFRLRVLDAGIAGDNTWTLLSRLDNIDWSHQSPRYVILLVGTNDGFAPPCDIFLRIVAIVGRVRRLFPKARIIVTGILPRGLNFFDRDASIRTTNAALQENAGRFGYTFFNPHDALLCNHQASCDLFVFPMNIHPTRKGYQLMTELLTRRLATLMELR
jgi:platelet-activating factor acetylhydrolase IB subunit beta/gamma